MQERSWTQARWTLLNPDPSQVAVVQGATGLSDIAARCLALRWTSDEQPDPRWLKPDLSLLHDPGLLFGMEQALERLHQAVQAGEHIRIITDYDVDGTTSSLILQAALRLVDPNVHLSYHIPNRFGEGYGFSVAAAEQAAKDGVGLIVTADIGVRDHASVDAAKQHGVDVLICDHHLPAGEAVPDGAIVVCPPQAACSYPNPYLAACGVSLKVATALLKDHPKFDAILLSLLKLAAIGTVADLVPLTSPENRAIVSLGLQQLNEGRHNAGLTALLKVCEIKGAIGETDLGFRVGPRINAAGRLEDARLVVELLTSRDAGRAEELAKKLDTLNKERQSVQRTLVDAALAKLPVDPPDPFAVVAGDESAGWHRGVVGIVASKVKDTVHRPAAVLSIQGDHAVGSVRSIEGIHAVRALESAGDLLVRFGGHPMAAGFTVPTENIDKLRERLGAYVEANADPDDLIRTRRVDAVVDPGELSWTLFQQLQALGPFGMKNPRPRLLVRNVVPDGKRVLAGGRLLKFGIPGTDVGRIQALWWGQGDRADDVDGRPLDLLGTLSENVWNGRRELQFDLSDVRDAQSP